MSKKIRRRQFDYNRDCAVLSSYFFSATIVFFLILSFMGLNVFQSVLFKFKRKKKKEVSDTTFGMCYADLSIALRNQSYKIFKKRW